MSWKIRHQGSPRAIEGLSVPLVVEGLQDGLWESTDEVMGPNDTQWVAIENHPQFAEVIEDLEPPPEVHGEGETNIDMNPLIDVALVLLIFFILITSYAALQKVLEMPTLSQDNPDKLLHVTQEQVQQVTIQVNAVMENGKPVIYVEGKPVDLQSLVAVLRQYVTPTKTDILIDADKDVDFGTIIAIQDAAKNAGILNAHFKANPEEASSP